MGVDPRPYLNMTPERRKQTMQNMISLHRGLALAGAIGQLGILVALACLMARAFL